MGAEHNEKTISRTWTKVIKAASFLKRIFQGPEQKSLAQQHSSFGHIAVIISQEKNLWATSVVQRFIVSLRDQMGYQNTPEIDIFAAQESAARIRQLIWQIQSGYAHSKQYELVMTVGAWASKEVRDELDKVEGSIPQVFCPALDPVGLGIIDSLEDSGRNISGVTSVAPNFLLQIEKLKALFPQMKAIALPCGQRSDDCLIQNALHKYEQQFAQACNAHDVELFPFHVSRSSNLQKELTDVLHQRSIDIVCALPEVATVAHVEVLIDACTKQQVPLCAAELSSVYHGAAIGFGERGDTYGPYAASLVCDLLVNRRSLRTLPVISLNHQPQMSFNAEALVAQGVHLSSQVRHLLSMASIFSDT